MADRLIVTEYANELWITTISDTKAIISLGSAAKIIATTNDLKTDSNVRWRTLKTNVDAGTTAAPVAVAPKP